MTDSETMTIHEQAQFALSTLLSSHPDESASNLLGVLERTGPDSPDAAVIKRAIDRLEEIAHEITEVEDLLTEANFSFGKIEA